MVLDSLGRSQKLGLLGLLVGVVVAAVVIPLVSLGGGQEGEATLTQAGVLSQIRDDLQTMADQIRASLNSSSPSPPSDPHIGENNPAAISVEKRRKREVVIGGLPPAPGGLPPAPGAVRDGASPEEQAPAAAAPPEEGGPVLAAAEVRVEEASASVAAGKSSSTEDVQLQPAGVAAAAGSVQLGVDAAVATAAADEAAAAAGDVELEPAAAAAAAVARAPPLLLVVDETSQVLDLLEKTDRKILQATTGRAGTSSPGEEQDLQRKIQSLTGRLARIDLHSPADKQLAQDLLARVLVTMSDVSHTLAAVEAAAGRQPGSRGELGQLLTRLSSNLSSLLTSLEITLNSSLPLQPPVAEGLQEINTANPNTTGTNTSLSSLGATLRELLTQTRPVLADIVHLPGPQLQALPTIKSKLVAFGGALERISTALALVVVQDEIERQFGLALLPDISSLMGDLAAARQSLGPAPAPGAAPATAPGTAPGIAPGAAPGTAPGAAPGIAPGAAPATAPGTAPGAAPGSSPGAAPGIAPGAAPGIAPGAAPGIAPGAAPGTAPGLKLGASPRGVPEAAPGALLGASPRARPGDATGAVHGSPEEEAGEASGEGAGGAPGEGAGEVPGPVPDGGVGEPVSARASMVVTANGTE